jgi:hypothetical protein
MANAPKPTLSERVGRLESLLYSAYKGMNNPDLEERIEDATGTNLAANEVAALEQERDEWRQWRKQAGETVKVVEAEVARLREAIRKWNHTHTWGDYCKCVACKRLRALTEGENDG